MKKKISGTKEWATSTVNIARNCEHGCRYCFAKYNAMHRFHRIKSDEEWLHPVLIEKEVKKKRLKRQGTIMFPSSHDIVPAILQPSIEVLTKLCEAGNDVLVVSKPHIMCITAICEALAAHNIQGTNRIFFRFTIGAFDESILNYWEPFAPSFAERKAALQWAFEKGFRTSVSVEPMLDAPNIDALVNNLRPFITDCIWIGRMNKVEKRVAINTPEDEIQVARIKVGQTDEKIWEIYNRLKNDPLIRWKESIKSVVGLPLATEAGTDL